MSKKELLTTKLYDLFKELGVRELYTKNTAPIDISGDLVFAHPEGREKGYILASYHQIDKELDLRSTNRNPIHRNFLQRIQNHFGQGWDTRYKSNSWYVFRNITEKDILKNNP